MSGERFLVTGAMGCIGAWTVRTLVRQGAAVTAFDLGQSARRLEQIVTPDELAAVEIVRGDITDLDALTTTLEARDITHVIHLAALQVPFCRADPPRGALVNVIGTVNVFEAVKRRGPQMAPVVYTSSIGMYAADDVDPGTGRLATDARAHPHNHYGVYKLANEGNARVYWLEDGIPSVGLRPMIVYGVGRDQGMTSGPTKAIVAAVLGRRYTVSFSNTTLFQYAEDAAHMLIAASRSGASGASVFNMPGTMVGAADLVAAIEAAVPDARGLIDAEPVSLPFPGEIDHDGIETLGELPLTPFETGVSESVAIYRALAASGRLDADLHGLEAVAAT
ncbi:MAG TPA: SDR family oxidoreductase [Candidatus Limnocylindrales bacterium]